MLYFALGAALALGLVGLGVWLGRRGQVSSPPRAVPPEDGDEDARRELREQQRAFETMLSYNADVAYGLAEPLAVLGLPPLNDDREE